MTEREMQNLFIKSSIIKDLQEKGYCIYEEADTSHNYIDVLAYSKDRKISFELKMKDYKKVLEQAINNKIYCEHNYIVMPQKELLKLNKYKDIIKKNGIGLIAYIDSEFKYIKKARYNHNCISQQVFVLMDKLIRGFHFYGINAKKSYR